LDTRRYIGRCDTPLDHRCGGVLLYIRSEYHPCDTIQIHVLTSDWQAREAELTKLKLESERERVREQNVN